MVILGKGRQFDIMGRHGFTVIFMNELLLKEIFNSFGKIPDINKEFIKLHKIVLSSYSALLITSIGIS